MIRKRNKPDLIVMLVLILGLGITLSGLSQSDNRTVMSASDLQKAGILIGPVR